MIAVSTNTIPFDEDQLNDVLVIDRLVAVDADEFMAEDIPEREALMTGPSDPLLYKQSINQLFAHRGTGKTLLALAIAKALATGSEFLKWKCDKAHRVMYIEGELPQKQLQTRIKTVVGQTSGFLKVVTLDKQVKNLIPSLHTVEGQDLVDSLIRAHQSEVLILDSISTLTSFGTNDEENWLSFLRWLMTLRSRGLCIIFLHHAGKSGMQRGHSRSEDQLDVSIKLSRPTDYRVSEGLRCVLDFDKVREECKDADSLEIQLMTNNGEAQWLYTENEDAQKRKVLALLSEGMSERDVADMTKVPKTTVHRWKLQTKAMLEDEPANELPF